MSLSFTNPLSLRNLVLSFLVGLTVYIALCLYAFVRLEMLNSKLSEERWSPKLIVPMNNYTDYLVLYRRVDAPNSGSVLLVLNIKDPDSPLTFGFKFMMDCNAGTQGLVQMMGPVTNILPQSVWINDEKGIESLELITRSLLPTIYATAKEVAPASSCDGDAELVAVP